MSQPEPNAAATFIVEVEHVKEVTLTLNADLAYWRAYMRGQGLFPFDDGGKAQLMIGATELRSMGKRTNEFTIGLVVCERPEGDTQDALFLVHAFNSSKLFAWIERTMFSTPYVPGRIGLDYRIPASVELADEAGRMVSIHMRATAPPAIAREELWQGKIYLPRRAGGQAPSKFFVAKLAGYTEIYPYLPDSSTLQIAPRAAYPVLQGLIDSRAAGKEWRVRANAIHARSRTMKEKQ